MSLKKVLQKYDIVSYDLTVPFAEFLLEIVLNMDTKDLNFVFTNLLGEDYQALSPEIVLERFGEALVSNRVMELVLLNISGKGGT